MIKHEDIKIGDKVVFLAYENPLSSTKEDKGILGVITDFKGNQIMIQREDGEDSLESFTALGYYIGK